MSLSKLRGFFSKSSDKQKSNDKQKLINEKQSVHVTNKKQKSVDTTDEKVDEKKTVKIPKKPKHKLVDKKKSMPN